ncbi:MAG TPA: hydantoinase/carbamoylase family amidase [Tepidisphaeraceae bacterium]|jgi:N-carbamoyl-L-amino-acid hydrolase|nr:hydantoinase/carbamoylase family amidase [Tepidisphaeraceae bacterium]
MPISFDPRQTINKLKELRTLTGDENGAQRVAFTPTWSQSRTWLQNLLADLPVENHVDEAGNHWTTLRGQSNRALLLGSHLDSVPNGGWLDGCLGVVAGAEILRRISDQYNGKPPITVRLVDWADEEGARFGKSLYGSSACSGSLDMDAARNFRDKDGISLPDALRAVGVDFEHAKESHKELANAAAYLELHIEQGPVLLDLSLPLATVIGTFGTERHSITFHGQTAHSGTTPMNRRRDAFLAAAKMAPEIYRIAEKYNGVCTLGGVQVKPAGNTVVGVVAECHLALDQRCLDASSLAQMLQEAKDASQRFAAEGNVTVEWKRHIQIAPMLFHPDLIALADQSIAETGAPPHRLPSGALHDAAEMARANIPTVMLFVQSLHGISHNKIEDTRENHLELAISAFDNLAEKTMHWIAKTTQ